MKKTIDKMTRRELLKELRALGRTFDRATDTITLRDWLRDERLA
jgi:hypothetical protein